MTNFDPTTTASWEQPTTPAQRLPAVTTTVVITILFGFFGLIPASLHTKRAREAGVKTNKYWKAFGWTYGISLATGIALLLIVIAVANASLNNSSQGLNYSAPTAAALPGYPAATSDPSADAQASLDAANAQTSLDAAASAAASSDAAAQASESASSAAASAAMNPTPQAIPSKSTITLDDGTVAGTVTVSNYRTGTGPLTPEGSLPSQGHFVAFTVRVDSRVNGLSVDLASFTALVPNPPNDDVRVDVDQGDTVDGALQTTTLDAGESAQGTIVFDAPSKHGVLHYALQSDGSPTGAWAY